MDTYCYKLEGKKAVPCDFNDAHFSFNENLLYKDHVGPVKISTVFLSIDTSLNDEGPILFETRTVGGPKIVNGIVRKYSTWEEAEYGHLKVVRQVLDEMDILTSLAWDAFCSFKFLFKKELELNEKTK